MNSIDQLTAAGPAGGWPGARYGWEGRPDGDSDCRSRGRDLGPGAGLAGRGGRPRLRRLGPLVLVLLLPLLLSGCLRRISGTYKDPASHVSLDFHRDGKVYAKVFGVPIVGDFEEKDNKIIIKNKEGDMFIDIIDATTLSMTHPLSAFTGELRLKRQN
ncbi:MAG: hypothetical protein VKJ44_05330 [Synechococcus sp.]|nr:hypothetical protein [Synechococcus sp.]